MSQYMLCRETPGTAAMLMNYRRFLSRSGQPHSSLLTISMGKPPGDEQEDHATTFSPGMPNALQCFPCAASSENLEVLCKPLISP